MTHHEQVTLACPYCQGDIERPLNWFKQAFFTCPACGGGLAAGQFATLVDDLDAAFDASVEEMLQGHGCGSGGGCGCGSGKGCH